MDPVLKSKLKQASRSDFLDYASSPRLHSQDLNLSNEIITVTSEEYSWFFGYTLSDWLAFLLFIIANNYISVILGKICCLLIIDISGKF